MITTSQYFGAKQHTDEHLSNAIELLRHVNAFLEEAAAAGAYGNWIDPDTGTQISGAKGGSGDGGFRSPDSTTGAPLSKHRNAEAIDIYDPDRILAQWIITNKERLAIHGLWIEDPRWSPVWLHLQSVPPKSGKRIFIPSLRPPLAPKLLGQSDLPLVRII